MKFPVNLATKPMETHRRFLTVCGTLIALLGLAFPSLVWHVYAVRKADETYRVQNENLTREIDSLVKQREELDAFFAQPENAKLHDRGAFINSIIDAQSLNWTRMFVGLEKVLPGGVRVLNVEPKLENGQATVKLTVGALTEDAKRDFLTALERSEAFSKVELTNVRVSTPGAPSDPIILELTVTYSGA
jgi:Tfp pilus assembly protein PilN